MRTADLIPPRLTCAQIRERLDPLLLGRLGEPEAGRVRGHLLYCDACDEVLGERADALAAASPVPVPPLARPVAALPLSPPAQGMGFGDLLRRALLAVVRGVPDLPGVPRNLCLAGHAGRRSGGGLPPAQRFRGVEELPAAGSAESGGGPPPERVVVEGDDLWICAQSAALEGEPAERLTVARDPSRESRYRDFRVEFWKGEQRLDLEPVAAGDEYAYLTESRVRAALEAGADRIVVVAAAGGPEGPRGG